MIIDKCNLVIAMVAMEK